MKSFPFYSSGQEVPTFSIPLLLILGLLILPDCKQVSQTRGESGQTVKKHQSTGTDSVNWISRGGKNYGIFAPSDAWLEGDTLPYFGSENEWSRRMFEQAPADRFYKRRGQRQLLAILDGETENAIEYCGRRLQQDPDDPEIHYMLTLANCALANKTPSQADVYCKKAEECMTTALKLGMPFNRFIAGPRRLMEPISTRDLYLQLLSEASPLVHGPMLGNVKSNSISCWVRTAKESSVQMSAWNESDPFDSIHSKIERSSERRDFTAVLKLKSLKPNAKYHYNILIDGEAIFDKNEIPYFNSSSSEDEGGTFRLAFGGGAGYNPDAEKIWNIILENRPDALFLLGDNVYVDLPEMPGDFHDYTYYRRFSRPEFSSLVSRIPVYTIWDDHDAGIDDIWMGPYRDQPGWKQPMVRHYKQNWVNPGYGTEEWPGCWYTFKQGKIEFFLLDGRTYRTCPFGPEPTMLGPVQKKWLLQKLQRSTAALKVLVSPVPWNFKAKPGSHDTWAGFQKERDEILDLIVEKSIDGIVLMSADRHRSEVWAVEWNGGYPLYEFLSSRLTNMHFHDVVDGSIFSYNDLQSFGILEFNTEVEIPQVSFQVVNLHGDKVYENTFQIGR